MSTSSGFRPELGPPLTSVQVAELVGGDLHGPEVTIRDVAALEQAGAEQAAFYARASGERAGKTAVTASEDSLRASEAGLLLLPAGLEQEGRSCITVDNPQLAMAQLARHFHPCPPMPPVGVHPMASVAATAVLGEGVRIGPGCVVEDAAVIEAGCSLIANVFVGAGSTIGAGCLLHPGVVVAFATKMGRACIVQANAVIGSDGFGFVWDGRQHVKVPQIGNVEIGDGVEIGAGSCIDRATFDTTRIGAGCIIDNLVQVGHNCQLDPLVVLCGQVGLSGSTSIGAGAILGGKAATGGHIKIGSGAKLTAYSAVGNDVEPGAVLGGLPAWDFRNELRSRVYWRKLVEAGKKGPLGRLVAEIDSGEDAPG